MKRYLAALALLAGTVPLGTAFAQQNATVRYMTGNTAQAIAFARSQKQRYEEANPHTIGGQDYNVTVEIIQGPESATDRYALYLQFFEAQSAEADVLEIDVIWPGDLATHLVDLNEYEGVQEAVAGHFPAIVENNTVDGKLVGIPAFTDAGLLYYRTDLLEEYGFDGPPATWTELEEMATTIMEGESDNPDFTGFVWQGEAYEGLTCDALEWIASNGGGTIVSPEGEIQVFNDQAIEILEQAAGWVGGISPQAVTGFAEEDARRIFTAGNAAFMRNWPYAYSLLGEEGSAVSTDTVGVGPLPAGDAEGSTPAATLGGWQLGVSRYSNNPEVAVDFALFATSPEEQLQAALEVSRLPTVESVYETEELLNSPVAWFAELLPVFRNAVARPSTITAPRYNEVSRAFFTAVHDVLTGNTDAETAMGELEITLEELTGLPVAGGALEVASR